MLHSGYTTPGVYRAPRPRQVDFPRARTDIGGFVGAAGQRHLHVARRVSDWHEYEQLYLESTDGARRAPPAGSRLAADVRAFFANGGSVCWVVNVAEQIEESGADALLRNMLGLQPVPGPEGDTPTGLELLLRQPEVAIVVLSELFAEIAAESERAAAPAPVAESGDFRCCAHLRSGVAGGALPPGEIRVAPLYSDARMLDIQRLLLERCAGERWRVFVLLAPPASRDLAGAIRWREQLGHPEHAALYWPWVRVQEEPGAPVAERAPLGELAGVLARVDLAEGPHRAPANASLVGVVGTVHPVDDRQHAEVYERGINLLRSISGRGVAVLGARTLRYDRSPGGARRGTAFMNVRRCLSAIARSAHRIGAPAAFEPNGPILRLVLSQAIWSYLLDVYEAGGLAGDRPEDAFYVRCDEALNPPETSDAGRLVCEIGVAIGEPAEILVFRLGRREGVVELEAR